MMKKIIIIVLAALMIGGGFYYFYKKQNRLPHHESIQVQEKEENSAESRLHNLNNLNHNGLFIKVGDTLEYSTNFSIRPYDGQLHEVEIESGAEFFEVFKIKPLPKIKGGSTTTRLIAQKEGTVQLIVKRNNTADQRLTITISK